MLTNLELMISEIVIRATAKVLGAETHPTRIEAIYEPLAEALVDIVVIGETPKKPEVSIKSYLVWELWNQILDEVEKEIPAASRIEVKLVGPATRKDRTEFTSGAWRERLSKPYSPRS